MTINTAAHRAASRSRGPLPAAKIRMPRLLGRLSGALLLMALAAAPARADLFETQLVPLRQFGFSTIGRTQTAAEYLSFYATTTQILGSGAVVRTGLGWDPTNQNVPGFAEWSDKILEPALARGIVILPGIRTLDLNRGGYRMPTDAQWAEGLRAIVRMYGPNGLYKTGGTYNFRGKMTYVAPHPSFQGLKDFELWNEPNTQGDLGGAMTPLRVTQLLKIGSTVMREEAARLGFKVNVIGPAIGGINLDYLKKLKAADANLFKYIDTLSVHAYTRFAASQCNQGHDRCVKTFEDVRRYMDANGGAHVHMATTEGGVAGDRGTCIGPQVRTEEQQRDFMVDNLNWIRARPWLKVDFWITPKPVDTPGKYSYPCDSKRLDIPYWESKLGVLRPDMSLKPWAIKYRELVGFWKLQSF